MQHTFGWQVALGSLIVLRLCSAHQIHHRSLLCPAGSPLRKNRLDLILNDQAGAVSPLGYNKTFIEDVIQSSDYCYNPKLWETVRGLQFDSVLRKGNRLTSSDCSTGP